jgi:hypothetical protein
VKKADAAMVEAATAEKVQAAAAQEAQAPTAPSSPPAAAAPSHADFQAARRGLQAHLSSPPGSASPQPLPPAARGMPRHRRLTAAMHVKQEEGRRHRRLLADINAEVDAELALAKQRLRRKKPSKGTGPYLDSSFSGGFHVSK